MAENSWEIVPPSDSAVIHAYSLIAAELSEQGQAMLHLGFFDSAINGWAGPLATVTQENNPYGAKAAIPDFPMAKQLQLAVHDPFGTVVEVLRNHNLVDAKTAGVDRLKVTVGNKAPVDRQLSVLRTVQRHFRDYDRSHVVKLAVEPVVRDAYAHREVALARLEELSQRLIEDNEEYRRRVDLQLQEDRSRLEREFETQRTRLTAEVTERSAILDSFKGELDKRKRELDDRDNTHARREIYKKFIEKVTTPNPAALSIETSAKRRPVRNAFWALLVAVVLAVSFEAWWVFASTTLHSIALTFFGLSVASLVGITLYYIRWEDNWADRHADDEKRIRQLGLDVDRASWVVEMALEWKEEKGTPIPGELLTRLTDGLFHDPATSRRARHPAEDLAAFLGAASKLRVKAGAGELEFDHGGLKQIAKG